MIVMVLGLLLGVPLGVAGYLAIGRIFFPPLDTTWPPEERP